MTIFEVAKRLDDVLRAYWRVDGWSSRVEDVYRIDVSKTAGTVTVVFLRKSRALPGLRATIEIFRATAPADVAIELREPVSLP